MGTATTYEEYKSLTRSFIRWLESYGTLIKTMGEIEKSSGKSFEELSREFTKPEILSQLIERLPPDLAGKFFALFLELTRLLSKDIRRLSSEEKIKVGKKLIELSKELEHLIFKELPNYLLKEKEGEQS